MSFIFFIIFMTVVAIGAPFILKFIFPHKITWKEVGVSITASIVISLLSSLVLIQGMYSIELWHGEVTDKRQVKVSCDHSYQCNCRTTTDSNGYSSTTCSTCYEHSHDYDWRVFTTIDNINIKRIDRRGVKEPPRFTSIQKGDPVTFEKLYIDYIKNSNSIYNTAQNDIEHPFNNLLPNYPRVQDIYNVSLVRSTYNIDRSILDNINNEIREHLKTLGRARQSNVLFIITDQDQSFAQYLKDEWNNGRKNDTVIVVGTDGTSTKISWSFVFSWSKNKMVEVSLRDDILAINDIIKYEEIGKAINKNISLYFERESIADYKQLMLERTVSGWGIFFVLLLQIVGNGLVAYYMYANDITVRKVSRRFRR